MHAHGINVLDEADGDEVVVGIAHDFELKFFPAQHAFFDQDLPNKAGGDAARADGAQLFHIIDDASAGATHGVRRADHHGIAKVDRNLFGIFNAVNRSAFRHFDAELVHRLLEFDAVFAALDGIEFHPDHLDAVFFKNPVLGKI